MSGQGWEEGRGVIIGKKTSKLVLKYFLGYFLVYFF